jgi:ubiquinone/menaquinone biosynthesis C-methylase UbiE
VITIEIGRRNYLLYLLLPHPQKVALLSPGSRASLDRINRGFNEGLYSGEGAIAYDAIHRYGADEQQEEPFRTLVAERWVDGGYGRALELGAGSGYFTALIARHATSVAAVEPVPDMQRRLRARCEAERLDNVEVVAVTAPEIAAVLPASSVDTAFVIQSLHHFHRRHEIFRALGRVVKPGGRLFVVEPHHNLRRVLKLLRNYVTTYRARGFRENERNWATHDFVTRRELRALCRAGGFGDVQMSGYWIPFARRLLPAPATRMAVEAAVSRVPGVGHFAAVLAIQARRTRSAPP